jgi:hypothetical protein
LVGQTAAEVDFRETYKSAIVAVQQGGKNTSQSLSSMKFTVGDVLILQASDESPLLVRPPEDFYKKDKRDSSASDHRRSSSLVNLVTRRFNSQNNFADDAKDTDDSAHASTINAPVEDDMETGFFINAQPDSESSDGIDPEQQVSTHHLQCSDCELRF